MPRRAVKSKVELVPLNMKVSPDLRSRLERAARQSGRSLTSEVGYRVERGFDYEKLFGSDYTQILVRFIADAVSLIEKDTGKRWNEEPEVLEKVLAAVRLTARAADWVGTDPDERPNDNGLVDLMQAVGEPAEEIVRRVVSDEELFAITEQDIFKTATK